MKIGCNPKKFVTSPTIIKYIITQPIHTLQSKFSPLTHHPVVPFLSLHSNFPTPKTKRNAAPTTPSPKARTTTSSHPPPPRTSPDRCSHPAWHRSSPYPSSPRASSPPPPPPPSPTPTSLSSPPPRPISKRTPCTSLPLPLHSGPRPEHGTHVHRLRRGNGGIGIRPGDGPPLTTILGLAPKEKGFHKTRLASFPGSMDPTRWDMPWAMAGLMVYLAR
mmetsp:Transcript_20594/g.42257  ORF Transcript_20594/g.42257 Transcript_20594/m.42257 type:complete len:218 (+) Transcript_20594:79-732(+)